MLEKANSIEPENTEVKRELARAQGALKNYQNKETKMFQKMFS